MSFLKQSAEISDNALELRGPSTASSSSRRHLVICTYNIRYARGPFLISGGLLRRVGITSRSFRPQLIDRNITRAASFFGPGNSLPSPDFLALQEADNASLRAGGHHIASELAEQLSMAYAYAGAGNSHSGEPQRKQWYLDFEERIESGQPGETGIAVLSRIALKRVERIELPWFGCPWRPRLAIAAIMNLGCSDLILINAHIDPHASLAERLEQHNAIIRHADGHEGPAVLLGDFNTLSQESCLAMRQLHESKGFSTPMPTGTSTWRSGLIRLHTDWIFTRGIEISRFGVARNLRISDHWPVWAELKLQVSEK
jgi:endonuclease/exonuclease/phosphatase family metal-dependent hydrolase